MIIAHEWPDPPTEENACIHCGTWKAYHETKAQNCVPRWEEGEARPRETRTGQSAGDFVADDAGVISVRIRELEAERTAAMNAPSEETD